MATATPAVELTPAEAAATRLAASFWAVGDLGVEADHAARKVTGRDAQAGLLVPHIPASGLLLRPLLNAIGQRQRVEFGYRSGVTGKVSTRVVEPWQVAFRDGGWYLLGHDNERGGPRAFRLSRVAGGTATVSRPGAFPIPEKIDVADLLGETTHSVTALIALAPGRGARLRAFGELIFDDAAATRHQDDDASSAAEEYEQLYDFPPGFGLVRYRYDDEREFADELAGLGAQVVVLAPAQLRAAVLKRLESARDLAKQIGR
jgi:proteasome accessory factor B